jgi:hypothetical protein
VIGQVVTSGSFEGVRVHRRHRRERVERAAAGGGVRAGRRHTLGTGEIRVGTSQPGTRGPRLIWQILG